MEKTEKELEEKKEEVKEEKEEQTEENLEEEVPKLEISIKSVIITLFFMVLFFFVGYCIGNNWLSPEDSETLNNQTKYAIDDVMIVDLMERLFAGTDCNAIEVFTNDHKIFVNDLSNEVLFQVTELASFAPKGVETMSIADFDTEIQKYFAKGYEFNPEEINYQGRECFSYYYDAPSKTFGKQETACGGTCGPNSTQYKIVKAVSQDDILRVTIKVLFGSQSESVAFYSNYERTEYVTDDYENIDDYFDKGATYIFTFSKADDNFVYESSERVA